MSDGGVPPIKSLYSRRSLLVGGATVSATALGILPAAPDDANLPPRIPPWSKGMGEASFDPAYGRPGPEMKSVMRRNFDGAPANSYSEASFTPLQDLSGVITPNSLCFVRNHAGVPNIQSSDHRLIVHGLVDTPLKFTVADIKRFPQLTRTYFLECAGNTYSEWDGPGGLGCQYTHGLMHNVVYTGALLRDVLNESGLAHEAKWIMAEGADGAAMDRSIPLSKALDDCMIVCAMNGEALYPEHGGPLRLLVPGWQGNMSVKWLRRIKVGDRSWQSREETAKYTDLLRSGRARQFAFVMDAKSVITSPSPQAAPLMRGFNMLSGLAWSGRGKIRRVDISFDGGRNWFTARLEGPAPSKAWVRFNAKFEWSGQDMVIMSRTIDETGYVQPSRRELLALRGANAFYHNNSIQAWRIRRSGDVENA